MDVPFDVLIIGAGPSGLCAAKTFLECQPDIRLRLIDSNHDLGGVWASEKLYTGLKTNNIFGQIDFTDFPMSASYGIRPGQHVTGEVMHEYLVAYAQKWDLISRITFNTVVLTAEKTEGGYWKLTTSTSNQTNAGASPRESTMLTSKLIVSTGVTNEPHRPKIPGIGDFDGPVIHSADLGRAQSAILGQGIQTIAVIGGSKSAYDAVYQAAVAGKEVEWIIRRSGRGPSWVTLSKAQLGPIQALREKLLLRRAMSFFSPWFWTASDGFPSLRRLLHATSIGRSITQHFWAHLRDATIEGCKYRSDKALHILEPEQSPFWYGTVTGVFNYASDFHEHIKSHRIRIHRADISHLSSHNIHLANDSLTTIHADALVTATGFTVRPTVQFLPKTLPADLGVPVPQDSLTPDQQAEWNKLDIQADYKISQAFPRLVAGPFTSPSSKTVQPYNLGTDTPTSDLHITPYRLYRAIAPPSLTASEERSLAFIGYVSNIASTLRLEIQCLWAYAYLIHNTTRPTLPIDPSSVYPETALLSRFARHRAPYGHGRWYLDLNFDQLPYIDTLMRDLGLEVHRKSYWLPFSPLRWLRELFEPYGQSEYRGVVREWKDMQWRKRHGS